MQNETQGPESRCAEGAWVPRQLRRLGRVVQVQCLWKRSSAKWDPGNGRSFICCSRDATTRKSLAICTLPSARSKRISTGCFCGSKSRAASSGLSSRLYFIGGNYGWRDSKPPRAQRTRTNHHSARSRGLQEPGDRRFARDHRARGKELSALDLGQAGIGEPRRAGAVVRSAAERAGLSRLSSSELFSSALLDGGALRPCSSPAQGWDLFFVHRTRRLFLQG